MLMPRKWVRAHPLLLVGLLLGNSVTAWTATKTASFLVQATVVSDCAIVSAPTLDFGTIGVQNVTYSATSTLVVNCTPATVYSLSLDAGTAPSSTIADRRMANGANSMQYELYSDAARTQVWGNTVGSDTVGGTGIGANQNVTIYGLIPVQTTQPSGVYTSTVTVTITY